MIVCTLKMGTLRIMEVIKGCNILQYYKQKKGELQVKSSWHTLILHLILFNSWVLNQK